MAVDETRAYLQSKRANVLFTRALAARLAGSRVTVNCVYPGLVATDLLRGRWWWRASWLRPVWRAVFLSPEAAGAGVVRAATSATLEGQTGKCFDRRGCEVRTSRGSRDASLAERLWRASEALVEGLPAAR